MKHLNLISYFGGKYPHLKWLIDQFPKGNYHFVDLMCGSANVALNVDYPLVTINDINDEVINLFHVLREKEDEFLRAIYFTPFSRAELNRIVVDNRNLKKFGSVERARRYFVKSQLGYGANGSQNDHFGTGFEWKLHKTNYYRVDNWNVKLKRLASISDKLRRFQIESRNALDLFESVNRQGNIVYIDPPYLLETRKSKKRYMHEVEDDFHEKLSAVVKHAKAFVAISGYDTEKYAMLFPTFTKTINKASRANVGKVLSNECLWTNYDPATINGAILIDFENLLR